MSDLEIYISELEKANNPIQPFVARVGEKYLTIICLLGFCESFNSYFYCRLCKTQKVKRQKITNPSKLKMRTKVTQDRDVIQNDPKKIGI